MRRLVIDDIRSFPDLPGETVYARTAVDALEALVHHQFDEVWFDYDLGIVDEKTGTSMDVADVLEEMQVIGTPIEIPLVVIHSANPVGRENLVRVLSKYYDVRMGLSNGSDYWKVWLNDDV